MSIAQCYNCTRLLSECPTESASDYIINIQTMFEYYLKKAHEKKLVPIMYYDVILHLT
jgi:hypothetical protein